MEYSDELLHKLQSTEYSILLDYKRFCEENGIHYFLIGGTMLGAVRHKGFIPWDDDIDVGMERSQYEQFISLWQSLANTDDLKSKYFLQCKETDKRTPLPYAKLRKNGTLFVEKETKDGDLHKGIFIDIFPFDKIPDKVSFMFKAKYLFFVFLMVVAEYKNGYRGFSNKGKQFLCALFSFIPYQSINKYQKRFMVRFNNRPCDCITSMASGYGYLKHKNTIENLCGGNTILFVDDYFECPKDTDQYLSSLFGKNYMELPPLEKRVTIHNVIQIQFND